MSPNHDLTRGSVAGTLLRFAAPFLLANVLQSLYGAVDLFVIGKYCGADSVAAVSTGTQVTQIVTSLMTGLTLGSTILVGRYTGMREPERVRQVISTSLLLFGLFAIVITALMLGFERPLLRLLQTPAASFEKTMTYVAICAAGNLFVCGYNAISAILRGCGDSVRPMLFVLIACVLNVILDYVLVAAAGMDVAGTALATILSQGVSMALAVLWLRRQDFLFDFRPKSFRWHPACARQLMRLGIPLSFQELMVRISFLYLMVVMNRLSVYAAAVIGVSSKYDVFAMLSATSVASALSALTAQNLGAGKPERARKALWYGLGFALGVSLCFWLWAQLSPQSMISVFTKDPDIIRAGVPFFRSCSYDYFLVSIVFCLNGYLNGREKTLFTMISCSAGALCLRIPMVWYFSSRFPDQTGMLGMIAPTVSGIMALYTLVYVLAEPRLTRRGR